MKTNQGFSLIEVVVYVGLLVILMVGGILAAYNIIEANVRNQAQFVMYNEGNFLLSKINWEIGGSSAITVPSPGTPGAVLTLQKIDGSTVTLRVDNGNLVIVRGTSTPAILNNTTVVVSGLSFENQISSVSQLISTTLTLTATTDDGKIITRDFETVKYLRK